MSLELPDVIDTYFGISNGGDASRLAACFSADATVTDDNRTHRGIDAIRAWKHEARQAFSYRVEPLAATQEGDTLTVSTRVVGDFPGSPVTLNHTFQLEDGLISTMNIAP